MLFRIVTSIFRALDALPFTGTVFRSFVAAEAFGVASRAMRDKNFSRAYQVLQIFENDSVENVWVASCQYMLGCLIYRGLSTNKDISRAINVIQMAACAGNSDAISYLQRRTKLEKVGHDMDSFEPWF